MKETTFEEDLEIFRIKQEEKEAYETACLERTQKVYSETLTIFDTIILPSYRKISALMEGDGHSLHLVYTTEKPIVTFSCVCIVKGFEKECKLNFLTSTRDPGIRITRILSSSQSWSEIPSLPYGRINEEWAENLFKDFFTSCLGSSWANQK